MPRPKQLSVQNVVDIFQKFDFYVVSQIGSHIKLRRISPDGSKQTLVVPLHKKLDTGTAVSIYRQASHYIDETELKDLFFNK
jgi:predicted RNA binding protein YcfA (HicA-like mRNA interferase family)